MTDQFAIHSFHGTSSQSVAQSALQPMNPDRPYRGPIDTAYSRKVIHSTAIHYVCNGCAKQIDVPTGTDRCEACLDAMKVAA